MHRIFWTFGFFRSALVEKFTSNSLEIWGNCESDCVSIIEIEHMLKHVKTHPVHRYVLINSAGATTYQLGRYVQQPAHAKRRLCPTMSTGQRDPLIVDGLGVHATDIDAGYIDNRLPTTTTQSQPYVGCAPPICTSLSFKRLLNGSESLLYTHCTLLRSENIILQS